MKNKILYVDSKGKKLSSEDIKNSLNNLGIKEGNIIFVHSDVMKFGKLGNVDSKKEFLGQIIDSLKEAVGKNGTIIMPAFTYSFTKSEMYDVNKTPSTVGILTEYFRKMPEVKRSIHPIFSVSAWGKEKEFFTTNLSKDSFGENSIFGKLKQKNAKILFLGAYFESCTFIHHIEKLANVKYRYNKKFYGKIKNESGKVFEDEYEFFVRDLERNVVPDFSKFEEYLLKNKLMKKVFLGDGILLCIDSEILFNEGISLIKKDPLFMIDKNLYRED